jgi:hypothetical protein
MVVKSIVKQGEEEEEKEKARISSKKKAASPPRAFHRYPLPIPVFLRWKMSCTFLSLA